MQVDKSATSSSLLSRLKDVIPGAVSNPMYVGVGKKHADGRGEGELSIIATKGDEALPNPSLGRSSS